MKSNRRGVGGSARRNALARQNRVTPFGELIATECRGTLMGNRGCLHDEHQRIRRPFAVKRWLICVLEFRGRYRTVMTPGRYTELFFLDEATALAAGHRPCAECQHARYVLFRDLWAKANANRGSSPTPSADEIDGILHAERIGPSREKRTYRSLLSKLPFGTMVANEDGKPFLVLEDKLAPWTPGGYGAAIQKHQGETLRVLTPPSIVETLSHGYPVEAHPSARCGTIADPNFV
jgi:hypothetical protein